MLFESQFQHGNKSMSQQMVTNNLKKIKEYHKYVHKDYV